MTRKELFIKDQSKKYGVEESDFFTEGVSYRHVKDMDGKSTLYKTKIYERTFISGGKETLDKIRSNPDITMSFVENYPHYLFLGDVFNTFTLPEGYSIKDVDPEDHKTIQQFIDLNTKDDIDDAEIYLDDPDEKIKLVFFKDKPVVYAGYRRYQTYTGDVGILVHPDHRKRGLAVYAVNEITKLAIKNGVLPMYRTWDANKGSMAVAKRCGYDNFWNIDVYRLL